MKNPNKIILDLCGGTGAWSKPYRDAGYDVRLITLPDYDITETEFGSNGTIFFRSSDRQKEMNGINPENVYGILAAPPCTMFSLARTRAKTPRDLREGMECVEACLKVIWECQKNYRQEYGYKTSLKFWALENPWGLLRFFLGKPALIFQPYEFGDPYSKKTCLWGNFNEPKKSEVKKEVDIFYRGKMSDYKKYKSISDLVNNPKNRQELRSITPQGFAQAFFKANQ